MGGEAYTADVVSALGFVAAVTERAQIGTSILPIYSRTPTLLAMTAVGLDQLSRGRFVLGLGASGPQVIEGFHGVAYDGPLARTREIIEICRSVWRRDRLEHDGARYQMPLPEGQGTGLGKALKIMDHPVRERIPIHVASLGPKNVEMTAEVCEGWLPLHFWPDRADQVWGAALRGRAGQARRRLAAARHRGRGSAGDRRRRRAAARAGPADARPVLRWHGGEGQELLQRRPACYGFEQVADEIQDAYLGGDKKAAAAMVPPELVEGMSLVGDEGFVRIGSPPTGGRRHRAQRAPDRPQRARDIETLAGWI